MNDLVGPGLRQTIDLTLRSIAVERARGWWMYEGDERVKTVERRKGPRRSYHGRRYVHGMARRLVEASWKGAPFLVSTAERRSSSAYVLGGGFVERRHSLMGRNGNGRRWTAGGQRRVASEDRRLSRLSLRRHETRRQSEGRRRVGRRGARALLAKVIPFFERRRGWVPGPEGRDRRVWWTHLDGRRLRSGPAGIRFPVSDEMLSDARYNHDEVDAFHFAGGRDLRESWCDEYRRKHPIRCWIARLVSELEVLYTWILDRPVWDLNGKDPRLVTARTGRELKEMEE